MFWEVRKRDKEGKMEEDIDIVDGTREGRRERQREGGRQTLSFINILVFH